MMGSSDDSSKIEQQISAVRHRELLFAKLEDRNSISWEEKRGRPACF